MDPVGFGQVIVTAQISICSGFVMNVSFQQWVWYTSLDFRGAIFIMFSRKKKLELSDIGGGFITKFVGTIFQFGWLEKTIASERFKN